MVYKSNHIYVPFINHSFFRMNHHRERTFSMFARLTLKRCFDDKFPPIFFSSYGLLDGNCNPRQQEKNKLKVFSRTNKFVERKMIIHFLSFFLSLTMCSPKYLLAIPDKY